MNGLIRTIITEHYNDHEAQRRYLEHQLAQPRQFRVVDEDLSDEDIGASLKFHSDMADSLKEELERFDESQSDNQLVDIFRNKKPWDK